MSQYGINSSNLNDDKDESGFLESDEKINHNLYQNNNNNNSTFISNTTSSNNKMSINNINSNNNSLTNSPKINRISRSSSISNGGTSTIDSNNIQQQQQPTFIKKKIEIEKFWKKIGLLFQGCGLLAIVFTVFLGLRLDSIISWNWWIIFSPIFAILLIAFTITSSRALSMIVSWVIRLTWCIWVLGAALFVFMLIVHLEYDMLSAFVVVTPLIGTSVATLLSGLYSFLFGLCVIRESNPAAVRRKQKYIIGGLPMLFAGLTLCPSVVMVAVRYAGIDDGSLTYAVCCIPLFTGDAIISCFVFFLLLFSFGGRDNSNFSIFQLISFEFLILCSLVFKILLTLKVDSDFSFPYIAILIPVLVGEVFLVLCGLNLLVKPPKNQDLDIQQNQSSSSSPSTYIEVDESRPLLV